MTRSTHAIRLLSFAMDAILISVQPNNPCMLCDRSFSPRPFFVLLPANLVEDHPLYLEYRRSMQNVTMSNLVKELEGYKLCNGVQTLELPSKLFHHVVPINHDTVSEHEEEEAAEEEEQQQFPHKGFWRA